MNVLVIEDEVNIAKPLCRMLEKNNITAESVNDGLSGYLQARRSTYDVIVLDIMLPEMDGLSVLKKLREESVFTPILLLTAKDSTEDKVRGLELGADDYLTKPFAMDEFIARVKALGRRQVAVFTSRTIGAGDIMLDTATATLTVGEHSEVLPSKEARMLEILLKNKGAIVSKDYLLDKVWGLDSEATDNTVEIYMHYLRKKISGSESVRITTRRNLGYILEED
ncbi:MAG: response regulator transcription factor [Eubacteriaceae bacterium]|nr:response regulator transcription factor [Eubacteriaceae bacterium]